MSTPLPESGSVPGLPPSATLYGYVPTRWICALFLGLFGISTIIHSLQGWKYRLWWVFPTLVIGGLCEVGRWIRLSRSRVKTNLPKVLGWSGRLWSSFEPRQLDPYLMQCVH